MTTPRPDISRRQNEPDMLDLLRAAFASHVRQQRAETVRAGVSLAVAALSILAAVVSATGTIVAVIGAVWTAIYTILVIPLTKREARRSATVQEMFDIDLFGLPWNATAVGGRLRPDEISQLTRAFTPGGGRGNRLRDWYVDIGGIPQPYDILICQQQNLAWDARLRRRWATVMVAAVTVWVFIGIAVGYANAMTIQETLLRWFLPSLSALIYGIEGFLTQLDIAKERERVLGIVQEEIDKACQTLTRSQLAQLMIKAREVQDIVFVTRKQAARVPDWFYARFRDKDESDFHANAQHVRDTLSP